jgi:type IV secretory pathway component VirB8
MVQQLGNSNQRLLGSNNTRAKRDSRASKDVFVANIAEKRYLWTARAFAVIVAVSICCNIVLLMAISQVIPLHRIEPFLLNFQNKEEQVYNIQPLKRNLADVRSITEVFVRQYVLMRSGFNKDTMEVEARWMPGGAIQEMSSQAVYEDFLKNTANRALELIKERHMVRNVRIVTVNELSSGIWQVEYETRDMFPDSTEPSINYWTASLKIAYRHKRVKYTERLKNPAGFTVTNYSLSLNKVQ